MHTMVVELYATTHGYGFCVGEDLPRVFFRIEDFHRDAGDLVLPVAGEKVDIEGWDDASPSPRASKVMRLSPPDSLEGTVKSFDSRKGWGFISTPDGETHFLHRSDMLQPFVPIIGTKVSFYSGLRRGKKRACHIRPLETVGGG